MHITKLVAGQYYHIYNRGVNRQPIFFCDDNWGFFLCRLRQYFKPELADVIAYCLMPNHYHLLVYISAGGRTRPFHLQRLCALIQNRQITIIGKHPVAPAAGQFAYDPKLDQGVDTLACGRERQLCPAADLTQRQNRSFA